MVEGVDGYLEDKICLRSLFNRSQIFYGRRMGADCRGGDDGGEVG